MRRQQLIVLKLVFSDMNGNGKPKHVYKYVFLDFARTNYTYNYLLKFRFRSQETLKYINDGSD